MAILRYEGTIASVSWIDPATGLLKVDDHPLRDQPQVLRAFLTGSEGFRYSNYLDVWANYDTIGGTIVGNGFTPASKVYVAPSFLGLDSEILPITRNVQTGQEPITFTQTLGARTQSPQKIAGTVYGPARLLAAAVWGYPPIWTELQLKLYNDGHIEGHVLRHSLFPSMTFYVSKPTINSMVQSTASSRGDLTADPSYAKYLASLLYCTPVPSGASFYDAVSSLEHWQKDGWGPINGTAPGPTPGNPWGITKYTGVTDPPGAEKLKKL